MDLAARAGGRRGPAAAPGTFVPDSAEAVDLRPRLERFAGRRRGSRRLIAEVKALGVRVSLFMDPSPRPMPAVREVGADRVELYTEPYAARTARRRAAGVLRCLRRRPRRPRCAKAWASTPATT